MVVLGYNSNKYYIKNEPIFVIFGYIFESKNKLKMELKDTQVDAPKLVKLEANVFDEIINTLGQLTWGQINPLMVKIMQDFNKNNPQVQ